VSCGQLPQLSLGHAREARKTLRLLASEQNFRVLATKGPYHSELILSLAAYYAQQDMAFLRLNWSSSNSFRHHPGGLRQEAQ